jgi:hypothetical protein
MATNMWEQTEEMAKKHDADSSTWLKLANDEDKAVVVFLGEHERHEPEVGDVLQVHQAGAEGVEVAPPREAGDDFSQRAIGHLSRPKSEMGAAFAVDQPHQQRR